MGFAKRLGPDLELIRVQRLYIGPPNGGPAEPPEFAEVLGQRLDLGPHELWITPGAN
ncbi:hypothetical protein SBA4_920005 [Candidatus Sulfopaludibacter sp. SbA4]|nr:hypothetical protein SBA4_920005 [Candidatus Sulfopaludibacter sp. SbA4]